MFVRLAVCDTASWTGDLSVSCLDPVTGHGPLLTPDSQLTRDRGGGGIASLLYSCISAASDAGWSSSWSGWVSWSSLEVARPSPGFFIITLIELNNIKPSCFSYHFPKEIVYFDVIFHINIWYMSYMITEKQKQWNNSSRRFSHFWSLCNKIMSLKFWIVL